MHQPARLPEIFDQILQNTYVLQFGSTTPLPQKLKFFLESKSNLTQNTRPPKTFFPEFKCDLTQNTPENEKV